MITLKKRHSQELKRGHSNAMLKSASASAVLLMALQGAAIAQETTTIVVTGIRKGIEEAISVKKNSDSIVEAISAEDIGKLPDNSIAESIARLPGLAAQRTAGRAQQVSIRGMSPDFSTGLLNGREQVSTGDSRGVEFDQYPSELLSGAVVYKTPDAALVGQGLSGTVDLQTVRPLQFAKRTVAVNLRKERPGISTPATGDGQRFSLSYIDQFADRKLGVALGFARLDGTTGKTTRFDSWGSGTAPYNGQTVNVPYNGFNYWTDQTKQTRDGAMAVVEYKPNKNFSSVLDLFYSKFDMAKSTKGFQAPLNDSWAGGPRDLPGVLSNATIVNGSATAGTFNNVRAVIRNDVETTKDELRSLGWKNMLKLDNGWTAIADLSYSRGKREQAVIETYGGTTGAMDSVKFTNSAQFTPGFNYTDPSIIKLTDVQGWGGSDVQAGYAKYPVVTDKIDAIRLSGKRDLSNGMIFSAVDLGLNYTDRTKTREFFETLLQLKGGNPAAAANYPGAGSATVGGIPIISFDPAANIPTLYDAVQKKHPDIYNKDWTVSEKVTTLFGKLDIDSKLGSLPVRGNVGVQWVSTDQSSTAYSVDKNGGTNDGNRPTAPFTDGKQYSDFLPSMNLHADLGGQQALRLGLAKVLARPTMNDMRASNGFGIDNTRHIYTGGGGNPRLQPFRAQAFDLSYEKYFGNKGYIAAAAFYKKLDTYIVNMTNGSYNFTPHLLPTTTKLSSNIGEWSAPTNGKGGSISGVELSASVPLGLLAPMLDGFGIVANYSSTNSSVNLPDTAEGGSGTMPLPGLSKEVGSLTAYYEKHGFSARIAARTRSPFIGEVVSFAGDRTPTYIKGETITDMQLGYELQSGPAKGLSFLLQLNNLTDAPFVRYRKTPDNVIESVKYGKTMLFGLSYKL